MTHPHDTSEASHDPGSKPLMRALGEFVGEIAKGVRTRVPVKGQGKHAGEMIVRRETREAIVETEAGPILLRRTVTDEVVRGEPR
jgi:hypothetical protein